MNNLKKMAALFLALTMICLAFASCGKKPQKNEGTPVAIVDGEIIYGNDQEILDYLAYYVWMNDIELPTDDKISYAYTSAVTYCTDSVIWYRIYEKELASKGITFSEKKLKDKIDEAKATFADQDGGYEGFRKSLGISKNFVYNIVKYEAISEEIISIISERCDVSDEEALAYFNEHISEYTHAPGIVYDAILLEILDMQDSSEVEAKKAEAAEYIKKITGGMDFDAAREEVKKKYSDDKYFYTGFASGEATLAEGDYIKVDNLDTEIKAIEDMMKENNIKIDANADKNSDEYKNYESYINSLYRAELMYALTTATKSGEIYSKPILSTIGYVVVKNIRHNNTVSFTNFGDVKDEIKQKIADEKFDKEVDNYREEMIEKYGVVFNKTDVDWQTSESESTTATTAAN